jgi:hypothetical protein
MPPARRPEIDSDENPTFFASPGRCNLDGVAGQGSDPQGDGADDFGHRGEQRFGRTAVDDVSLRSPGEILACSVNGMATTTMRISPLSLRRHRQRDYRL